MKSMFRLFLLCSVCLITGCAIFGEHSLDRNDLLLTDSSERGIFKNGVTMHQTGLLRTDTVTCVEPSPDTAQAVQRALAAAIESEKVTGSLSSSSSSSRGIAQLAERTTSVQLLRDQMFRACEAYSNGAITGTSYSLLMSRNNKAMVTLMLAENAASAFGRTGVTIGGKSSSSQEAMNTGLVKDFSDVLDKLNVVDKELTKAKEDAATANTNYENWNRGATTDPVVDTTTDTTTTSVAATLTWDVPETRENGDNLAISELNGYKVVAYDITNDIEYFVMINDPTITQWDFSELASGTWEFSIASIDTQGSYSSFSAITCTVVFTLVDGEHRKIPHHQTSCLTVVEP